MLSAKGGFGEQLKQPRLRRRYCDKARNHRWSVSVRIVLYPPDGPRCSAIGCGRAGIDSSAGGRDDFIVRGLSECKARKRQREPGSNRKQSFLQKLRASSEHSS